MANNGHNYHDEIEVYQGAYKDTQQQNNTSPPPFPTHKKKQLTHTHTHTHNPQSYRLWWYAADEFTMSHGTYIHIMKQRILTIVGNIVVYVCI